MKRLLFVDGTKGFSPHRLKEKPCGGIITSLTLIPQHLAKYYDIYVLSIYEKEEKVNGVQYINKPYKIDPDIVIFNRNMLHRKLMELYPKAKYVWWLHDIVDHRYLADDAFKSMDKVVALSRYCVDSFSDYYDVPRERFSIIPNGVDESIFYPGTGKRNKNLFVCASAPIKGLKPIEYVYWNLKRQNPDVELRLYTSQKLHDLEDDDKTKQVFENFKQQGIKVLDPIPQRELADVLREARGLLMPNHYPEICSNLLLQAQACGCPVVSVPIGAVPEFIEHGKTGLLTKTYPHDLFWWWKDFTVQVATLMHDDGLCGRISENAAKNVFPWSYVGLKWEVLINSVIKGE